MQIMNKFEYLSKLKSCLSKLPAKERNAAIKYYDELFKDAGPENEEAVIMSLGSPQKLARTILVSNNSGIAASLHQTKKGMNNVRKKMNKKQTIIAILLMIATFPLWGMILLAIAGVIAGIFVLTMLILFGILIGGIVLVCTGVAYVMKTLSVGVFLLGLGIAFGSITFLLFTPLTNLLFYLVKKILNGCINLFNKIIRKTEARAK